MTHRLARRLPTAGLLVLMTIGLLFAVAVALGEFSFVTTHGRSMNPLYYQGDLVIVDKAHDYRVGDIVAYRVKAQHLTVLHRIIGGDANGFVMKGDNNQSIDPYHPTPSQILGRAALHIPRGGIWLERITSPVILGMIAFGLVAGGGTVIQTRRRRRRAAMAKHANDNTPLGNRLLIALPVSLRPAATAFGVLGLAGLIFGAFAWLAAPTKIASTTTHDTRQMTFAYSARVGHTPAYDSTTVKSPDPVFRKLTDTVDLHLAYKGQPGTIAVNAELSTPSGWHSTVSLEKATTFTGKTYENTVQLNLDQFDARAAAAAAATGLPAGPLSVAIVPRIESKSDTPFEARLMLSVTPLQMSMSGDAKSLVAQNSTNVPHETQIPRTISLVGRHITVAHARTVATDILLIALLGAAVLWLIARHTRPSTEGADIRRRYSNVLAAVAPVTTPPDRPLIEVDAFATLAKLAERCGLLVMHWSRSGVDTFVVLDENTTYRYRTDDRIEPDDQPVAEPLDAALPDESALDILGGEVRPGGAE